MLRVEKPHARTDGTPFVMQDFYASIRSGIKKVKTKIKEGPNPDFNEIFDLEAESYILKLKVKDAGGASCLGSCSPFNTLLGEA